MSKHSKKENQKKKSNEEINLKAKSRKRFHISFSTRITFYIIFLILSLFLGIYFIAKSLKIEHKENLSFNEHGNVTYSVCLNKNNFFDENCLSPNMSYVASLIKSIPLSFNYQFESNKAGIIDKIDYKIIAKLVINNRETSTKYYEKEYVLQDQTSEEIKAKEKAYSLNKKVEIDYEYYNEIANKFRSQYGVDADSYLEVYLETNNHFNIENKTSTTGKITVQIPLSETAIEIKLNTKEMSKNENQVIITKQFRVINWVRLISGSLLILASFYYFSSLLSLLLPLKKKTTKYDRYLYKILKEYDRLIVETTTLPKFEDYKILKIKSFNELLDVRDNLRLPIMFYRVTQEKSHFYILHDNNLYLYTLKDVDLKNRK